VSNVSNSVVRCGVVWCGVAWCGVVWCGAVWRGVVMGVPVIFGILSENANEIITKESNEVLCDQMSKQFDGRISRWMKG
jgi:hypothetical protein